MPAKKKRYRTWYFPHARVQVVSKSGDHCDIFKALLLNKNPTQHLRRAERGYVQLERGPLNVAVHYWLNNYQVDLMCLNLQCAREENNGKSNNSVRDTPSNKVHKIRKMST